MHKFSPPRRMGLLIMLAACVGIFFFVRWRMTSSGLSPVLFVQSPGDVGEAQFSRDGRLLMTVDQEDHLVTFRDPVTGQVVRQ